MISLVLVAYRIGYQRGRIEGPILPTNLSTSQIYTREYDVSDILVSQSDADRLLDVVRRKAAAESWAVVGGYAEISFNLENKTLNVDQTWPGHVEVVRCLEQFRDLKWAANSFEKTVELLDRQP